jgi:magnesium chelatase subunit I
VDGLRGDLVINRVAKALVAFEGRNEVTVADIGRVIGICLNHRCAGSGAAWGRE